MKIPFDIKYRPQIESGEYRVETFSGYPVIIYRWDFDNSTQTPIMGSYVFEDGKEYVGAWNDEGHFDLMSPNNLDLFIVTPEEEMTEFEKGFLERVFHQKAEDLDEENREIFREDANYVLGLAREQFIKEGYVIEKKAFHDAVENISDKHLAEMSVEYSLHCKIENGTRHAIMNWEAFQKVAQKFIDIGKAEALKDLPRWKKANKTCFVGGDALIKDCYGYYFSVTAKEGCIYILKSDLEKLPGFKEDKK